MHASHGNWGKSAGSFGVRLAAPLTTGGLVYALTKCEAENATEDGDSGGWCEVGQLLAAFTVGLVGITIASAIDASAISWEAKEPKPTLAPAIGVTKTSAWLGLAGQF